MSHCRLFAVPRRILFLSVLICMVFSQVSCYAEQDTSSSQLRSEATTRIYLPVKPEIEGLMKWLKESPWCWGVEIEAYESPETIQRLRDEGWNVILHMNGHKETLIRDCHYKNWEVPDVEKVVKEHIKAAGGDPGNVYWEILLENDSAGVAHPQEVLKQDPETYAEAKALFDKHLQEALSTGKQFPKVNQWGLCGYASGAHYFARDGIDCVIIERANDDVDDLQTGIAFTRGAAKQYDCEWGMDLSLWWGVIYGCIQDLPTSYHKRHFYISYFSGAETFRVEGGDLFYDRENDKFYQLTDTLNEFGDFTLKYKPGTPDVSVAVMLPEDHGWITPPYWRTTNTAWNYAEIPYQQGYRGVDGFFGNAFPGSTYAMNAYPFGKYANDDPPASPFALTCIVPMFAPEEEDVFYAEPPLPFGRFEDRNKARETMHAENMETAPYRPMGDSRWGDIFDVFTHPVSLDVLKQYKALVVLGPVKLDRDMKAKLKAYVQQGGTLIVAAGVVGPDDADLTGVKMQPEFRVGRAWKWQSEKVVTEAYHYLPAKVHSEAQTFVWAVSDAGQPLVVKNELGKGRVITSLIPWYEGANQKMAGAALRMYDQVLEPMQTVKIDGMPVEWISTRDADHRTVLIANHAGHSWKGKVTVLDVPADYKRCTELLSGQAVEFQRASGNAAMQLEIEPYDLKILRWHK